MAAQLTRMNARVARCDFLWMARAISSLPEPVSPRIKTVESVAATLSTSVSTRRRGRDDPTISSNIDERSISSRSAMFSLRIRSSACLRSSMSVAVAYHRTTCPCSIAHGTIPDQKPTIVAVVTSGSLFVFERLSRA